MGCFRRSLTMAMPIWQALCCGSSLLAVAAAEAQQDGKAQRRPVPSRRRLAPGGIVDGRRSLQQMVQIYAQLPITATTADDGVPSPDIFDPTDEDKNDLFPPYCPSTCDSKLCACVERRRRRRHDDDDNNFILHFAPLPSPPRDKNVVRKTEGTDCCYESSQRREHDHREPHHDQITVHHCPLPCRR
mmetsp:Transcript_10653/g.26229  ORF Transcript_10653/g.26229 Transcript_10653/m.26229 type:complete len:187 (-) Transcript_10653:397-957(-)